MERQKRKCVFAGTFDPPTLGHKYVIETCLDAFDEVVVAIAVNPDKKPFFSVEQRKEMLALTVKSDKMRIVEFAGTIAELLKREHTKIYVRGVRSATDFDFENANLYATHKLDQDVTAFYLPCPQRLLHVSSSMVRTSLHFNTPIDEYVTKEVQAYIQSIKD